MKLQDVAGETLRHAESHGKHESDYLNLCGEHVSKVVAVLADYEDVVHLLELHRAGELSWKEIFERLSANTQVELTKVQADELHASGLGVWSGSGRMIITTRREAFARLSDLSAAIGFDHTGNLATGTHIARTRKDWIGPYIRARFDYRKPERAVSSQRIEGGQDV